MAISDDDLDDCFSTDDFAVNAIFATSGGNVTVPGYFTGPTEAVEVNGAAIEASEPTFVCRTSLITAVRRGNTCTVNSTAYKVERYQKTGMGASTVWLKA